MSQGSSSADGPARKRYRRDENENSSESEEEYVPYVPVKERKKHQLMKLGRLGQLKDDNKAKSSSENENENEEEDGQVWGRKSNISLLDQHTELKKLAEAKKESAMERQLKEEERILESVAESKALMGVAELAKGIQYEDPIKTRKTPFTRREREIVLWILRKHASILGNKKTDANTSHLKKMAWYQIGLEYNSMEEIQEQVTSKQLLKLWENMRRKYKPEIQAKMAESPEFTMEDEIDIMLSALGEGDYSSLSFNGDGSIEVILNEAVTLPDEDSSTTGQTDNSHQVYSSQERSYYGSQQISNHLDSTTGTRIPNTFREQNHISQQEAYEPYISTTSNPSSGKARKPSSKSTYQQTAEQQINSSRDELYQLRLEHARQELREQKARAQEAEYRSETAKETLRATKAKADVAELELAQKKRECELQIS